MSGGIVFDLYALAFAAFVAATTALVYALRAKHHRPFDWKKDAPEYATAKPTHVKVVP